MGEEVDKKDIKPSAPAANNRNNKRWQRRGGGNTPVTKFKGKTKEIEEDIFDLGGTHDAALFSRSLKNIADYIQLKHTSDVSEAVRNMTDLDFLFFEPGPPG